MAEKLEIIIIASDKASDTLRNISKAAGGLGGIMGGALKVGLLGAAAGVGALGLGLAASVREATESQKAAAQLDAVLKSTKGIAGVTAEQARRLASALQDVTTYEDETVLAAETMLLRFRSITHEAFPEATRLSLDLATALGIDATSAAKLLGKALETPGEGLLRLKQAGVSFTDEQENMLKKMVEAGDTAKAQAFIMDTLRGSIGGAAEAAGNTFAGKLAILQNKFSDIQEEIGGAFLPALTQLADGLVKALNSPEVKAAIEGFAKAMEKIAKGDWEGMAKDFWNWLTGKDGVITKAKKKAEEVAQELADRLRENWPRISSELSLWAGRFWDWIPGALSSAATELGKIVAAMLAWVQSADGRNALNSVGAIIGRNTIEGIRAFFSDVKNEEGVLRTLGLKLVEAARNLAQVWGSLGVEIGFGIGRGVLEGMTGQSMSAEIDRKARELATALLSSIGRYMGPPYNIFFSNLSVPAAPSAPPGPSVPAAGAPWGTDQAGRTLFANVWGQQGEARWWWEHLGLGTQITWPDWWQRFRSARGMQHGGRVGAGEPVIVGEAGPEMFVPERSGSIIPRVGASSGLTFVYAPLLSLADEREAREKLTPILDAWFQDARRRRV